MLANGFPHQLRSFMTRHKVRIFDGAVLVIITLTALFYCFEVDVFANEPGEGLKANTLELDEVLLVSAIFCGGLVIFALRRLAEQKRETARRIAAEQEIRTLAFHDALTGLPNRRQFDDALRAAIAAPPRAGGSHAVLLLDLNGFKRVNDVFGHAVGDEVLIRVAGRLSQCVRGGDLVARLGGDEFVVLLHDVEDLATARVTAARVLDRVNGQCQIDGTMIELRVSVGVALAPEHGREFDGLLRRADRAMYIAKAAGCGVAMFDAQRDADRRRDGVRGVPVVAD
jgi:diguanylate cyclase (GGDEF)-like protein